MCMESFREGQYFYARHRNKWGVWKRGNTVNGVTQSQFISDFQTQTQAKDFVYKMNGYRMKKEE